MPRRSSSRQGGGPQREPARDQEFSSRILNISRVARVVAGGRRFSFRVAIVLGDRKGRVGVGVAKGPDVSIAVEKATTEAKKRLITVLTKEGTIPRDVSMKYASARIVLRPAKKGRGIIAGGPVRVVCELAGIRDVSAKVLSRSTNALNIAYATLNALKFLGERVALREALRPKRAPKDASSPSAAKDEIVA